MSRAAIMDIGTLTAEDAAVVRRVADAASALGLDVALIRPEAALRAVAPGAAVLKAFGFDFALPRPVGLLVAAHTGAPPGWMPAALGSCRALLVVETPMGDASAVPADAAPRVIARASWDTAPDSYGNTRHAATLLRGDGTDPLLRVDDYPTGVRPIADDLEPLHAVLRTIDGAGLAFHLGIVPALLTDPMAEFLRGLQHLVPVMHGFDHRYFHWAPILLGRGDPTNQQGGVKAFNEFEGQPRELVLRKLATGRRLLEQRTGRAVTDYIPPCNVADRATGRALPEAGFLRVLSERRVPGCALPVVTSDFYGRADEYDPGKAPHVASLHATWEADLAATNPDALPRFLADLVRRRDEARGRVMRLGEALAG